MLEVGDRLRSYEPLWESWRKDSYIGGGSFGKVYKLRQDFFGVVTYSVVKIISINLSNEALSRETRLRMINDKKRFVAEEIRNMYQLTGCPNIVECKNHALRDIYDDRHELIGFDILIRMDLYDPLSNLIKKKGGLSVNEVERLAYQIATALGAMHKMNMLHRDVKPDNIYLDSKKQFFLGDFGVSKQEASSSYNTLAGTQPYIAPEVWRITRGESTYSQTADIYSYGLTLYYLLNNNLLPLVKPGATTNDRSAAVADRLRGKRFPPPANGSVKLKSIVMKCCEFAPEKRFQSMNEVLEALRNESFVYPPFAAPPVKKPATGPLKITTPSETKRDETPVTDEKPETDEPAAVKPKEEHHITPVLVTSIRSLKEENVEEKAEKEPEKEPTPPPSTVRSHRLMLANDFDV